MSLKERHRKQVWCNVKGNKASLYQNKKPRPLVQNEAAYGGEQGAQSNAITVRREEPRGKQARKGRRERIAKETSNGWVGLASKAGLPRNLLAGITQDKSGECAARCKKVERPSQ